MRVMVGLVVAMGVLILAGGAVVAVTIMGRLGGHGPAAGVVVLDQPAGTRIVGVAGVGERMAVVLQGGGPDRVVVLPVGGVRLAK